MTKLIKEANRIIHLWRTYGPKDQKIQLETIFNEVVLKSSNGDMCKIVYDYFDSFEGLMARESDAHEWRIGINKRISYPPRQNFTLAHEIGHFIGHRYKKNLFECSPQNMNDFQNEGFEKEANQFAAHLLMPPDVIRRFDEENIFSHETVSELAEKQGVSRAAAAYRWIELSNRQLGFVISRDEFINSGRASDKAYQAGIFFRQGDEVPSKSLSQNKINEGKEICAVLDAKTWHILLPCHESTFSTNIGGYLYTYLDFGKPQACPKCPT